jgi:signal transduction histidine kinase
MESLRAPRATSNIRRRQRSSGTTRKHSVKDHRERFAFATQAAKIGYWFCDLPFDRLIWDDCVKDHFWLPADAEVTITLFYAQLHPDDRERIRNAIDVAIETRTQYDIEYRTVSSQGDVKWIRAVGRAAYDSEGQPIRFDGVTRDITTLKEAEEVRDRTKEALLRSERQAIVGRLAATIAHEINNPLAAITNLLYLIEKTSDNQSVTKLAKSAMDEVSRASEIVGNTLRFNRGGEFRSRERASRIVESAMALYEVRLRKRGIKVSREYAEGDHLACIPSQLRQVFANLIANALDAMTSGGKLLVRTRSILHAGTREPGVRISIADTGCGIDQDTLSRLFQPFVSTKGEEGTGLGLWVSREILEKHNATIRVRSRKSEKDSGTVFSIWIPLGKSEGPKP